MLDVKVGSGAFMKELADARELAATMVELGGAHGVRTVALLTDMDTPLGRTAGNALEVAESVEVLAGGGPADVVELTLALAREMLAAAGLPDADPADALRGRPGDGRVAAHDRGPGRRPGRAAADRPRGARGRRRRRPACSPGWTRTRWASPPGVSAPAGPARRTRCPRRPGWRCCAKPGDQVTAGDPLLRLHTDEPARIERALAALDGAVEVGDSAPAAGTLVLDRIASD